MKAQENSPNPLNLLDQYAKGWRKAKIGGQTFDSLFSYEAIPLSWFFERFFSIHTMPKQLKIKKLLAQLSSSGKKEIEFDSGLDQKRKKLLRYYFLNEKGKLLITSKHKTKSRVGSKPTAIFLTYLNHIQSETHKVLRFENIGKKLRGDAQIDPFLVVATASSQKCYKDVKQFRSQKNMIYSFVTSREKKIAHKGAQKLSLLWKGLTLQEKEKVFAGRNVWNTLRYALDFYFSYEFMYFTILYFETAKTLLESKKAKVVVLSASNGLIERCFAAAAAKKNIPTLQIQHGAGMKINPQLLEPYKIAVFSSKFKERLVENAVPTKNIHITGPVVFDDIVKFKTKRDGFEHVLILTNPFVEQGYLAKEIYFSLIEKILEELKDFKVTFKLHPREKSLESYEESIQSVGHTNANVFQKPGADFLYSQIQRSDVVLNFSSTTALEAMILERPVITLLMPGYRNAFNAVLHKSKATIEVDVQRQGALKRALDLVAKGDNLGKFRSKFVADMCGLVDGNAYKRVTEIIYSLVGEKNEK